MSVLSVILVLFVWLFIVHRMYAVWFLVRRVRKQRKEGF